MKRLLHEDEASQLERTDMTDQIRIVDSLSGEVRQASAYWESQVSSQKKTTKLPYFCYSSFRLLTG